MPKSIVILMSAYNGEKYIKEQLDSILGQKCGAELSVLVRDDGSTDSTRDILRSYAERSGGKIRVIEGGKTLGSNAGFFDLLGHAGDYDYYAISDQDDVWMEDKLQTAIDRIEQCGSDGPVLYSAASYLVHDDLIPFGMTRKQTAELTFFNTIIQNICPGHNQVMNRALFERLRAGEIDPEKIYVYDSWIVNTAMIHGTLLFDNTPHALYRQHKGNQLGSGGNALTQFLTSARRLGRGDGKKYRLQIAYFLSVYRKELAELGYLDEVSRFLGADGFFSRLAYAASSRLYRQSRFETAAFRIAYVLGKY